MLDRHTKIEINQTTEPKQKPDQDHLVFGKNFTDHMFVMDYTLEKGWHDPRIEPYTPFTLDPASMVFHYGQAVFEGLKAFKTEDGEVQLFRPEKNAQRFNLSNERMSMPTINEEFFVKAIQTLVELDKDWVPDREGSSLYIRPYIMATEPCLGVRPSHQYIFAIILSPVGAYYSEGINPVNILVENNFVRAVRGGTGIAKTSGNYAASLKAQIQANDVKCAQVLWLDGVERKYIEEVGSMNVFFKINGEIITPQLNGSILEGITRNSVIHLLKEWNIPITERRISIEEVIEASKNGTLEEAFGTGTAAVISPIGGLHYNGELHVINQGKTGGLSKQVYDTVTGIQYGKMADPFGWTVKIGQMEVKN